MLDGDGSVELYAEFREMARKLIADMGEVRNGGVSEGNIFMRDDKVFERVMKVLSEGEKILAVLRRDEGSRVRKSKAKVEGSQVAV